MEKTLFIHVWMWEKDGSSLIYEQEPVTTIEESLKNYLNTANKGMEYLHTIHIKYDTKNPRLSYAREMDIEALMPEEEEDTNYIGGKNSVEENHEHKTLCAKFLNKG